MAALSGNKRIGSKLTHGLSEGDTVSSVTVAGEDKPHTFSNLTVVDRNIVVGGETEVVCETENNDGIALYARPPSEDSIRDVYDVYAVHLDSDEVDLGQITSLTVYRR